MASQILLNPIGSGGDVYPFLAIGRELQKRGHHVAVMTNRTFIENVGQAGLEFIEIGSPEELRAVGADPALHGRDAWKLALRWGAVGTMRQTFNIIADRSSQSRTMLIAPCLGLGARMAAEKLKIPLATLILSPFVIRSVYQSPIIPPLVLGDWVPRISKRTQFWFADRFFVDPVLASDVDSFRREIGLPVVRRFFHRWCFSRNLNLALFPEIFAAPQPDWPSQTQLTGPVVWDSPADPGVVEALNRFVEPGHQAIAVLAGSAGPESPQFYEHWIQAADQLGRQLILLEKKQNMVPTDLPNHVFHAKYLPFDSVLSKSDVVAHGGGVGTTLRCLLAGVPQILFPKVNDQPDNANRVKRLGIGKVIRDEKPGVERMVAVLKDVLGDSRVRQQCAHVRKSIPDIDPVRVSCDLIESTFDRHHGSRESSQ